MEYVLLCDSCIRTEGGNVERAVKIGVDSSFHPYVDRECFEISKAEKCRAGGDLVTDALDLL